MGRTSAELLFGSVDGSNDLDETLVESGKKYLRFGADGPNNTPTGEGSSDDVVAVGYIRVEADGDYALFVKATHENLANTPARTVQFTDSRATVVKVVGSFDRWRGTWAEAEYTQGDTVLYNGEVYVLTAFSRNTPNTPNTCLLYTSPSPRDRQKSRMPSSA